MDKTKQRKQTPWSGDWRALGLSRAPKNYGQYDLLLAARDCLTRLVCFQEVLAMMRRPQRGIEDIVKVVRREIPEKSHSTILKYVSLFKSFYLQSMPVVTPAPLVPGISTAEVLMRSVPLKPEEEVVPELREIRALCELQKKRLAVLMNIEAMAHGRALTKQARGEIETYAGLLGRSLDMQMEAGRIVRAPRGIHVDERREVEVTLKDETSKSRVFSLLTQIGDAMDKARHNVMEVVPLEKS